MQSGILPACFSAYSLSSCSFTWPYESVTMYRKRLALPAHGSDRHSSSVCLMFSLPPIYNTFMLACITQTPEDSGTPSTLALSKSSHCDHSSLLIADDDRRRVL